MTRNVLLNILHNILAPEAGPDQLVNLAGDILTHNKELPDKLNEEMFEAVNLFIMKTKIFLF